MSEINWDIRRQGRAWTPDEWRERRQVGPEKLEMLEGKLLWNDEERITTIALLLENVGVDAIVALGDLNVWKEAVAARERALSEVR